MPSHGGATSVSVINKGDKIFKDCSTHEAIRQGIANSGEQLEYVSTQVNAIRSHLDGMPP